MEKNLRSRHAGIELEIFGIVISGPNSFDFNYQMGMACETTQGKRYGIRMDKIAYEHLDSPLQYMVNSLFEQCRRDWIVTLEVTYGY